MIVGRLGLLAACAMLAAAMLGGCQGSGGSGSGKPEAITRHGPAPAYSKAAAEFNQTVDHLDRISARANILLTYFDDEGNERHEDPEGRLQIVRPDKLALSLGKAGQTIFWFGCDAHHYWWIDLSDKSKRYAAVGMHDKFTDATAARIGVPIKPLDLIRVMGVVKMDPAGRGATQWSEDGRLLGITEAIGDRGFQRTWVDPKTMRPVTIEIFDRGQNKVLVAEHTGDEPVEITRNDPAAAASHPRMPSRVEITHLETDTVVRLTLTGVRDGPISDKAFDLSVLLDKYPVDKTIDLDARRSSGAAGN